MYNATLRNLLIVISWAVWLSSCSAPPPSGQQIVLRDDALNFRYTLAITTRNAYDESGSPRDGTLTIITTNTPIGQLQDISITDQLSALANCDLVIESILEELAPKQELFSELDKIVKPSPIN